jgi:hypothetical protein
LRWFIPLAICSLIVSPCFASESYHPVNISIFHPVSLYSARDFRTSLNLSLLYGNVGSVGGVDLAGVATVVNGDVKGIQISGLFSKTGGDFRGIGAAGGLNVLGSDGKGLQAALGMNINLGDFDGAQFAGFTSFTGGTYQGIQLSGFFNLVGQNYKLMQVAGAGNTVGGSLHGIQIASTFNFVGQKLAGGQLGLVNIAGDVRGFQLGIANAANVSEGVQIGVVNIAEEQRGTPVGVLLLARNGRIRGVYYSSNYTMFNLGVKTAVNHFYSMIVLGGPQLEKNDHWTIAVHYGYEKPVGPKLSIGADAGYVHVMTNLFAEHPVEDENHFALQARFLADFVINDTVSLFGGVGLNFIFDHYSYDSYRYVKGLSFIGVSLF